MGGAVARPRTASALLTAPARRYRRRLYADVARRNTQALHAALGSGGALPDHEALGLDRSHVECLCSDHGIARLPAIIGQRGESPAHLARIAWKGSVLADLGCPRSSKQRVEVLEAAALFNLAVALTDSVVDDAPAAADHLAGTLDPVRLARRLAAPGDPASAIPTHHGLGPLAQLWDDLLVRLSALSPMACDTYAPMLAEMHRSEFKAREDRLPAKTLPLEFIGLIVRSAPDTAGSAPLLADLYRELGRLVALVDDWSDLSADVRRRQANQFILARGLGRGERFVYIALATARLSRPRRLGDEALVRFGQGQRRVLDAAGQISAPCRSRTAGYLIGLHR